MLLKFIVLASSFFALAGCSSAPTQADSKSTILPHTLSCQEGTIRKGFITPMTQGDLPCSEGTQTCVAGSWQGPVLYDSCENNTKSCGGAAHGSVVNGYMQPTSPTGIPCTPATKTCLNGVWMGPEVFANCSEL